MQYLVSISIGPVQDFIATARRSRDLWFGSWLLSELSKAAALHISRNGGQLIFPALDNPQTQLRKDSDYGVVNKLLAIADVSDPRGVHQYCLEIRAAMRTRLGEITNAAFRDLKARKLKDGGEAIHWHNADAQLEDLIEFYWAARSYDPRSSDPHTYELARKQTEALLAARKATRSFNPVTWNGYVPKSSIDGQRESVIDEAVFDPLDARDLSQDEKAKILKRLRTQFGVRGKERLCGVGLLKRHGKPTKKTKGMDNFYSTSHVAALPLLNRLRNKQAANDYVETLRGLLGIEAFQTGAYLGHVHRQTTLKPNKFFSNEDNSLFYDGHLLFKERLRDFFPETSVRGLAEKALGKFLESAFSTNEDPHPSPAPYYAILHADGDRMGAVIDFQAKGGHRQHQKVSSALNEFATQVERIVEENHYGSLIYSGGDDVLALLPLHTVLQCARDLAKSFETALTGICDEGHNSATLSVGIAIGHHLDPLQDTLALAREAEKTAKKEVPNKERPEKNALAITLSKRSGADRTVKGSWDSMKPERALDDRLARFVFLLLEDELPDGVAYELRDLALRLRPAKEASPEERETLLEAQIAEAKRILRRKQPKHGKREGPADEVLTYFCGRRDKESAPAVGIIDHLDLENWTLEGLADEIIVARELAKAIEQSGTKGEFVKTCPLLNDPESTHGDE